MNGVALDRKTINMATQGLGWFSLGLGIAELVAPHVLARWLGLREGETVLVHAAAGGVGILAVQIARATGARVIGTASEANHEVLRSFGAEPVEYGDGLADRVREIAGRPQRQQERAVEGRGVALADVAGELQECPCEKTQGRER